MEESQLAVGMQLVRALDLDHPRSSSFFGGTDDGLCGPLCAQEEMEMDIDMDVFRPSSDFFEQSPLEEVHDYNGPLASACLQQPSDLANLEQDWVDLEQMLLMEDQISCGSDLRHDGSGRSGIALQLLHLHAIAANGRLTPSLFASSRVGPKAHHQVRCVGSDGRVFRIGTDQERANELPPKYFQGVQSSPRKNRVHRRTFGIVDKSFSFGKCHSSKSPKVAKKRLLRTSSSLPPSLPLSLPAPKPKPLPTPPVCKVKAKGKNTDKTPTVLLHRVDNKAASQQKLPLETKRKYSRKAFEKEVPAKSKSLQHQCQQEQPLPSVVPMGVNDENVCPQPNIQTNGKASLNNPIAKPVVLEPRKPANPPATPVFIKKEAISSAKAMTPAVPTSSDSQLLTPPGLVVTDATATGMDTSLSPAVTTTKVSMSSLMHLNREVVTAGKLGRVGKFQWKVTSSPSSSSCGRKRLAATCKTVLTKDFGKCGLSLPPRYYRVATSSPQKARVHSSTFGSFARSFSFSSVESL